MGNRFFVLLLPSAGIFYFLFPHTCLMPKKISMEECLLQKYSEFLLSGGCSFLVLLLPSITTAKAIVLGLFLFGGCGLTLVHSAALCSTVRGSAVPETPQASCASFHSCLGKPTLLPTLAQDGRKRNFSVEKGGFFFLFFFKQ